MRVSLLNKGTGSTFCRNLVLFVVPFRLVARIFFGGGAKGIWIFCPIPSPKFSFSPFRGGRMGRWVLINIFWENLVKYKNLRTNFCGLEKKFFIFLFLKASSTSPPGILGTRPRMVETGFWLILFNFVFSYAWNLVRIVWEWANRQEEEQEGF